MSYNDEMIAKSPQTFFSQTSAKVDSSLLILLRNNAIRAEDQAWHRESFTQGPVIGAGGGEGETLDFPSRRRDRLIQLLHLLHKQALKKGPTYSPCILFDFTLTFSYRPNKSSNMNQLFLTVHCLLLMEDFKDVTTLLRIRNRNMC